MVYIANDLHGVDALISNVVAEISKMNEGDILIINGDGAGARGPIMNNVVRLYYEVRRGEINKEALFDAVKDIIGEEPDIPQDWIYYSAHAGIFRKLLSDKYPKFAQCMREELNSVIEETLSQLSEAASKQGVKVIYSPGNGEIVPDDFIIDDIAVEKTVTPDERYYAKLARSGFFEKYDIEYVPYAKALSNDSLVIGANLLDLSYADAIAKLVELGIALPVTNVIVHYPPTIAPIGRSFSFWSPNRSDIERIGALEKILQAVLDDDKNANIFFGHIHLGAKDERMNSLPSSMGFSLPNYRATWVKPGSVIIIE